MTMHIPHENQEISSITPAAYPGRFSELLASVGTPRLPSHSGCDSVGLLRKLYPSDSRVAQKTPLFLSALHAGGTKSYPDLLLPAEHGNWCDHRVAKSVAVGVSFPMTAEGFEVDCESEVRSELRDQAFCVDSSTKHSLVRSIPEMATMTNKAGLDRSQPRVRERIKARGRYEIRPWYRHNKNGNHPTDGPTRLSVNRI